MGGEKKSHTCIPPLHACTWAPLSGHISLDWSYTKSQPQQKMAGNSLFGLGIKALFLEPSNEASVMVRLHHHLGFIENPLSNTALGGAMRPPPERVSWGGRLEQAWVAPPFRMATQLNKEGQGRKPTERQGSLHFSLRLDTPRSAARATPLRPCLSPAHWRLPFQTVSLKKAVHSNETGNQSWIPARAPLCSWSQMTLRSGTSQSLLRVWTVTFCTLISLYLKKDA